MTQTPQNILKQVFGFDRFISLQADIIENLIQKKDGLVVMPTGGGKSLCYQLPALIFEGLTVVVSPLISLMKDQIMQLRQIGVEAAWLNSTLGNDEYRQNVAAVKNGRAKLLYVAPEALFKEGLLALLDQVDVACLAVDEAHCISAWGHDFRPEYRRLAELRTRFPKAACIALTATATPRVQNDIRDCLGLNAGSLFVTGFDRPNLFLEMVQKENPYSQVKAFIAKFPQQPGIIYCYTRQQVDTLAAALKKDGVSAAPYHAGLAEAERHRNQELFLRDDVQIIVATIAFGMGIDKSNIRFVLHHDVPQNIESYYQEIGRAGRDGLRADCLMLFSFADVQKLKFLIAKKEESERRVAEIHFNALITLVQSEVCRRMGLLAHFGQDYGHENCSMCDNCTGQKVEKTDVSIAAQKFLSCVKRTGERFGATHIIDVLRGSNSQKVARFGHERLSTYGIGAEYTKKQWQQLSYQFLHQGLMVQDGQYGGLALSPKAWDVFKGETVLAKLDEAQPEKAHPKVLAVADYDCDTELFALLRTQRKALADAAEVPPYVVFSDKTLVDMASHYPRSEAEMCAMHGIGAVKYERYGKVFEGLIDNYCKEQGIEPAPKTKDALIKNPPSDEPKRYQLIGAAHQAGRSLKDLADTFNIKEKTLLDHLYRYLKEGNRLPSNEFLTRSNLTVEVQKQVLEAFDQKGVDYLSPVYKNLQENFSYETLRLMRLYYLARKSQASQAENSVNG
jgi:ATP-dependent DNA helicase RecQ